MRILIYICLSEVFHYVHFRRFGELKMRFLLNTTFVKRLYVVKNFGYICVWITKINETHLFPNHIIAKRFIGKIVFIFKSTV